MKIAGVGWREAPDDILYMMFQIGEHIAKKGHILSSGNAEGSDSAFASGANSVDPARVNLYLPWPNFRIESIHPLNNVFSSYGPEIVEFAKTNHANWSFLGAAAKKLMTRNAAIIKDSNMCVYYKNPNKSWGGGTGHAVACALSKNLKMIDLSKMVLEQALREIDDNII